ncbi:MAG: hypothetical protein H6722_12475, partial [Sandaracinus sp.]|nr:hypothetical protein [Sandaracinus sp.]
TEPHLEDALPAAIATLDVRWESVDLLARAFDEGVFRPTRADFDGPVGELGGVRERGRLAARLWRHAVDEGIVALDELVSRLLRAARSKKADEAKDVVAKLGHLRGAGFDPPVFVNVLDALLAHPKSTVTVAAHNLLGPWAAKSGDALFHAADDEGASHVAKHRPKPVVEAPRRSVEELVAAVAALPKGRSLADQATRREGELALSAGLARAWREPSTRAEAEAAMHALARTKTHAELAGGAFAAAWLDDEQARLATWLEEATALVAEGVLLGLSRWTDEHPRDLQPPLFAVLRALHLAKSDRLRRAAWFCRFSGAAALREALLRSGEVSVLALVGWGEERGAKLSVRVLHAQLTQRPTSLDVCLPAIPYALHGAPRHELLTTLSGLLDRGEVPLELARRLVPLVAGVLLDRDFAMPTVDRRACHVLTQLFELGAEPRGTLPLLGPRLHEHDAAITLRAGARLAPRLPRGLEEGIARALEPPVQLASHPARAAEELERRFLLAGVLATEVA